MYKGEVRFGIIEGEKEINCYYTFLYVLSICPIE
jgi:hypothetical protein